MKLLERLGLLNKPMSLIIQFLNEYDINNSLRGLPSRDKGHNIIQAKARHESENYAGPGWNIRYSSPLKYYINIK